MSLPKISTSQLVRLLQQPVNGLIALPEKNLPVSIDDLCCILVIAQDISNALPCCGSGSLSLFIGVQVDRVRGWLCHRHSSQMLSIQPWFSIRLPNQAHHRPAIGVDVLIWPDAQGLQGTMRTETKRQSL